MFILVSFEQQCSFIPKEENVVKSFYYANHTPLTVMQIIDDQSSGSIFNRYNTGTLNFSFQKLWKSHSSQYFGRKVLSGIFDCVKVDQFFNLRLSRTTDNLLASNM